MSWLIRALRVPASESPMGFITVLSVVALSVMSIALVWQAQIIAQQRDIIRWLEHTKFGG